MSLIRSLVSRVRQTVLPHAVLSYSQEGEDLILARIFAQRTSGFYVDVGAHHPQRFSNTYKFYRSGWRGINIDAMPGSMAAFNRLRPRDINVEIGISSAPDTLRYFVFNEPALNTFDAELAAQRDGTNCHIVREVSIATDSLQNVLNTYLPAGQNIDFLTVDVEGFDLVVLQSNDWSRFRPDCICVEHMHDDLLELPESLLYQLLSSMNYQLRAKTASTLIFANKIVS